MTNDEKEEGRGPHLFQAVLRVCERSKHKTRNYDQIRARAELLPEFEAELLRVWPLGQHSAPIQQADADALLKRFAADLIDAKYECCTFTSEGYRVDIVRALEGTDQVRSWDVNINEHMVRCYLLNGQMVVGRFHADAPRTMLDGAILVVNDESYEIYPLAPAVGRATALPDTNTLLETAVPIEAIPHYIDHLEMMKNTNHVEVFEDRVRKTFPGAKWQPSRFQNSD